MLLASHNEGPRVLDIRLAHLLAHLASKLGLGSDGFDPIHAHTRVRALAHTHTHTLSLSHTHTHPSVFLHQMVHPLVMNVNKRHTPYKKEENLSLWP